MGDAVDLRAVPDAWRRMSFATDGNRTQISDIQPWRQTEGSQKTSGLVLEHTCEVSQNTEHAGQQNVPLDTWCVIVDVAKISTKRISVPGVCCTSRVLVMKCEVRCMINRLPIWWYVCRWWHINKINGKDKHIFVTEINFFNLGAE